LSLRSGGVYGQRVMRVGVSEPLMAELEAGSAADQSQSSAPAHNSVLVRVARLRRNQLVYVEAKPVDRLRRDSGQSTFTVIKLQYG